MLRAALVILALVFSNPVMASCTTSSYYLNGKLVTCTTCCHAGGCTTNCI